MKLKTNYGYTSVWKVLKCPFTCCLNKPSQAEFISSHSADSSKPSQKSWCSFAVTVHGTSVVSSTTVETTKNVDKRSDLLSNLSENKSGTKDVILYKYFFFLLSYYIGCQSFENFKEFYQRWFLK